MNQYSQAYIKNFTGCEGILYAYPFMCLATLIQYIGGSHIRLTSVADYIEQETKGDNKENDAVCTKKPVYVRKA